MGWVRNADDGVETDGPLITGVAAAVAGLAAALVALRLYVRLFLIRAFGHDDWLIVVSLAGAWGYAGCAIAQTTWGLGLKRLEDMPDGNLINFGKLQYAGAPCYVLGLYGFKMSLLFSYMRFVPRPYYIACIIIAVLITMAHIAFVCCFLFICIPIAMQWDQSITDGKCADAVTFYLTFSALTIIFDVVVMIVPFPVLLTSQIQKRKKIVLLGLFTLGVFVTAIQIIRIQTIKNLKNYLDSAKSIQWSIVEVCIGIIIASIPTLAPLVKYYREKTRSGTNGNSNRASKYAMQSWRSGRSGQRHPASGDDDGTPGVETRIIASADGDSTENILSTAGITKTTDVRITRGRPSGESGGSSTIIQ